MNTLDINRLVQDHRVVSSYIKLKTLIITICSDEDSEDYNEDNYDYLQEFDYVWNDNVLQINLETIK